MNPQANKRCKLAVELMAALQLCLSLTPAPTWAASLPNDLSAGQQLLYCAHLHSFRQKGKAGYLEYRADVLAVVRPAVLRYITPERFDAESEDVRLLAWHAFREMMLDEEKIPGTGSLAIQAQGKACRDLLAAQLPGTSFPPPRPDPRPEPRRAVNGEDYAALIQAAIKRFIVLDKPLQGNPLAEVEVRSDKSGRILGRRLVTSSGVAEWDRAVLRAIDRVEVLPVDEAGHSPPVLLISFRPLPDRPDQ